MRELLVRLAFRWVEMDELISEYASLNHFCNNLLYSLINIGGIFHFLFQLTIIFDNQKYL